MGDNAFGTQNMQQRAGNAFVPANTGDERWNNMNQTDHPVEGYLRRHAPELGQAMPDREGTVASRFPNVIEQGDPRDEKYALRGKLLSNTGAAGPYIPGVGLMMADQSDVEYFHKKALDVQEADFKAWFLAQMDLSTPEKQAYWQSKFPDVFQEKQRLMEKQLDIQLKLAKMRIFGPQNKDDYMLLWGIQRGYIKVPDGPLFEPTKLQQKNFHEGLFNIKKLFPRTGKGQLLTYTPDNGKSTIDKAYNASGNKYVNLFDPLSQQGDIAGLGGARDYSAITNFRGIGA